MIMNAKMFKSFRVQSCWEAAFMFRVRIGPDLGLFF